MPLEENEIKRLMLKPFEGNFKLLIKNMISEISKTYIKGNRFRCNRRVL